MDKSVIQLFHYVLVDPGSIHKVVGFFNSFSYHTSNVFLLRSFLRAGAFASAFRKLNYP